MIASHQFLLNKASAAQIAEHLLSCDADFVPPLSARVDIGDYATKIVGNATRFEAWSGGTLVGFLAAYCNNQETRIAYITSVSVLNAWTAKGIAARLMDQCIEHAKSSGMQQITLEVAGDNTPAIRLYEERGFLAGRAHTPFLTMNLYLNSGAEHEQTA